MLDFSPIVSFSQLSSSFFEVSVLGVSRYFSNLGVFGVHGGAASATESVSPFAADAAFVAGAPLPWTPKPPKFEK